MRLKLFKNRLFVYDNRKYGQNPMWIVGFVLLFLLALSAPFIESSISSAHPWLGFVASAVHFIVYYGTLAIVISRWVRTNKVIITFKYMALSDHRDTIWCKMDLITQFWVDEQRLYIQRINRVDEMDYSSVPADEFQKLVDKLTSLNLSYTTTPPELV